MEIVVGMQFRDMDPRHDNRIVTVESLNGTHAYCTSNKRGGRVQIALSRLSRGSERKGYKLITPSVPAALERLAEG